MSSRSNNTTTRPCHLGRAVALGLAVLVFIPTGWLGMVSFAFWNSGGEERAIGGFTDEPGLLCLLIAGICGATIVATLCSMSRD